MISIVIAGVGGQGSLLASKILGSLFMARGMDVKVNEVHGMSQRGGSVVTMVRAGVKVHSPIVTPGTADLLIGLELTEAARAFPFLSPNGKAIVSSHIIPIKETSEAGSIDFSGGITIDAQALASEAGNIKCENTVLLGAASLLLDFTTEEWESSIRTHVKPQHIDVNLKAFTLGKESVKL